MAKRKTKKENAGPTYGAYGDQLGGAEERSTDGATISGPVLGQST